MNYKDITLLTTKLQLYELQKHSTKKLKQSYVGRYTVEHTQKSTLLRNIIPSGDEEEERLVQVKVDV